MKYFFKTLTLAVLISLVASLFLLSFKAEEPQDSAPVLVETQQITDNLSNPEEIKEYPVTVAEKGDLRITLAGLQERWDGYTYHWHATLFAEDKTTVITKESVRGYCGIEGYATTLSLPDMEAGTYYLQMTSVAYQNPLMATFTDASYQISITPFYHSVPETPASDKLKTVSKAGEVICKIEDTVYVKLNDGEALRRTMEDLASLFPAVSSVSVVPVGLSAHREGLCPLQPVGPAEAKAMLEIIGAFGESMLEKYGTRVFYAADELFLKAGEPIPEVLYYEDFPQIENGVGMMASFEQEVEDVSAPVRRAVRPFSIATGMAAMEFVKKMVAKLVETCDTEYTVYGVKNKFFGESIDVAGLITGGDIAAQLRGKPLGERLLIPTSMLRYESDVFLDDMTLAQVQDAVGIPVIPVKNDGEDFLHKLFGL